MSEEQNRSELEELLASMREVLDRCVWSQTMTHESLVTYLIEESYELVDAVDSGEREVLIEELGDVLLQVVFHSEIAVRTPGEEFDFEAVARSAKEKMIRRHPHVFGDEEAPTIEDVLRVWSAAKATEKEKAARESVLDGIPQAMSALALASKVLSRAQRAGMLDPTDVTVPDAASPTFADEEELGRVLLDLAWRAGELGLDPERALRSAVAAVQADVRSREPDANDSSTA